MGTIKLVSACIFATFFASALCHAKDWRGITPLHSTCEDVKRILNVTSCETTFTLDDEIVNIDFSKKPCADGWNVPPGTVISVTVYAKTKPHLNELGLNIDKYKKVVPQHQPDWSIYLNMEEGMSVAVTPDGRVQHVTFGPSAKDEHLRFPNSLISQPAAGGNPAGILKFDEYDGRLSLSEERQRLDDFALTLQAEPNAQGFILAYAGRRARAGEAQARAERARNYLANTRNIERARIVTVNGGYREEFTVELFVGGKDGAAPIPSPTVCPTEVQIINEGSVKNNNRRSSRPRRKL